MNKLTISYDEARSLIKSGDVLSFELKTTGAFFIRLGQKIAKLSDYKTTHSAIAWWLGGRLYVLEMDGKYNVLRPFSQYQGLSIHVSRPSTKTEMVKYYEEFTAKAIHYSAKEIIRIGLRLITSDKAFDVDDKSEEVCSTWVNDWLNCVNVGITDLKLPAPAELQAHLLPYYQFSVSWR